MTIINISIEKNIKNINFNYNFNVKSKKIVIFGPSGSGKSTLLNIIAGFIKPDYGKILINNRELFCSEKNIDIPINLRKIGYLTQEDSLFPNMNIIENLLYGTNGRFKYINNNEVIYKLVRKFQIYDKINDMPCELSCGQKQRVALIRAILSDPLLLLLDEPFSALDTAIKNCLKRVVIDISNEMNIPIIFVTHDINDCYYMGEETIILDNCSVLENGETDKIVNSPKYIETAKILDFRNIWKIDFITNEYEVVLKNKLKFKYRNENKYDNFLQNKKNYRFITIKQENIKIIDNNSKYKENDIIIEGKILKIDKIAYGYEVKIECTNYNNFIIDIIIKYNEISLTDLVIDKLINVLISNEYLIFLEKKDYLND
jgi:molybdate transport system ATP-binding protein